MRVKFPWYKRMYALLSGSPVYDTSALTNSSTPLDTSVLSMQKNNRQHSPDWDDAAIDASFLKDREQDEGVSLLPETLSTPLSPRLESPELDGIPNASFAAVAPSISAAEAAAPTHSPQADVSATPTAVVGPSVPRTSSSSSLETPSASRKRKDPFEQVRELTATYTNSRLESERVRAESKRQRLENELDIQRLKNESQDRQRQHEAEERECQRRHELQLIEKQIVLAQLQARNANAGSATNMAYTHGFNDHSQKI
jgi:hypothetical protein